jgi:plastocyanin
MTSMDKAAIGFTIGIVAVAVAIASMGGNLQSGTSSSGGLAMAPVVSQQEKPVEPEVAKASQKTMEEMMEQQRQGTMEETKTSPVQVTPPKVEDVPKMTGPKTVKVSVPTGTSVPGCETTNKCYIPTTVSIKVGDTVSWSNDDTAAHTVTSGSPTKGPDGNFDSSLFMAGATFDVTFDKAGSYDYFCMVHPWMIGKIQVS